MPIYTQDAGQLFLNMRQRMNREPTKLKQHWLFTVVADGVVPEQEIVPLVEPILAAVSTILKLKRGVNVDVEVEEEDDQAKTFIHVMHKGVMQEEQLATIHQQVETMSNAKGLEYKGCVFFLKYAALDATEFILQQIALNDCNPAITAVDWEFGFSGSSDDPAEATNILMMAMLELGDFPPGAFTANYQAMEVEGGEVVEITIGYRGKLTEAVLTKIHKRFRKVARKLRLEYEGVDIGDGSRSDSSPASQPQAVSIAQGIAWTDKVIGATSKFKIDSLPNVAEKIRTYHLQQLAEIGMNAADWMPTAAARLQMKLRPKPEIVKRLMAAFATTAWVCAPVEVVPNLAVKEYLAKNGLSKSCFSDKEIGWMQMKRNEVQQYAGEAGWITENIWSLAWMLGYQPTPNVSGEQVAQEVIMPIQSEFMRGFERTFDELMTETEMRPIETVIALEDLLYCAHNSVRTTHIAHGGLMQERRVSLTWALSPGIAWDDTDVST